MVELIKCNDDECPEVPKRISQAYFNHKTCKRKSGEYFFSNVPEYKSFSLAWFSTHFLLNGYDKTVKNAS